MRWILKKIRRFLAVLSVFCVLGALNVFAYAVDNPGEFDDDDSSSRVNITVNVESPDVYDGTIEFYCGRETFYMAIPAGETTSSFNFNVPGGVSKVAFIDPDDVGNSFTLTYDKTLDADKQKEINVVMTYSESSMEVSDEEIDAPDDISTGIVGPEVYDFSDGQEYGTILVSCSQYGSVDSVIYSLLGKDRTYDVTLNNDNGYQANLLLPAGTYRELTKISVTTSSLVTDNDSLSFAWGHRNSTYFGNNYELTVDDQVSIDDLIIKMNYEGDLREIDDNILMGAKIASNYTEIKNNRREEILKKELPEKLGLDETIAETEAPKVAEAVVTENTGRWKVIVAAGVAVAAIITIAIVWKIKKEDE